MVTYCLIFVHNERNAQLMQNLHRVEPKLQLILLLKTPGAVMKIDWANCSPYSIVKWIYLRSLVSLSDQQFLTAVPTSTYQPNRQILDLCTLRRFGFSLNMTNLDLEVCMGPFLNPCSHTLLQEFWLIPAACTESLTNLTNSCKNIHQSNTLP